VLPASLLAQKQLPQQLPQQLQARILARAAQKVEADSIAKARNLPVRVERPDGTIFEIQRFENDLPRYYITDNINAAKTISTNKLWSGGGFGYALSGSGVTLGEWDGGNVLTTHQEFGGRVTSNDPAALSTHSTHVAGTMIAAGVNASAHGMSHQASLIEHDWTNDDGEMASEAGIGLKVSNHSYGLITGWNFNYYGDNKWVWFGDSAISEVEDYSFGFYDTQAETWDGIAYSFPNYLICKSAGNDRNEGPSGAVLHWFFKNGVKTASSKARNRDGNAGYDCIGSGGVGKNVLTVGAVDDLTGGYSTPGGVIMSSFSCWGPTDDGRIKPDIVANGVGLFSTIESGNTNYGSLSGTSMATPNASGSLGLIHQYQAMLHGATPLRSATVKALVINTADEAGPATGPDYNNGWGLMNTLKAVQLMTRDSADGFGSHIREINLAQTTTQQFDVSCDGTAPLRATIAWTDPAGNPTLASLDPPTLMLNNDLDLRIIRKRDNTTYQPYILNPASPSTAATTGDNIRDNVEQVYLAAPERGVYTIRITHKGATLIGGSQAFSAVVSGNVASIGPLLHATPDSVELTLIPGGTKIDSIRIANYGDTTFAYQVENGSLPSWFTFIDSTGSIGSLDSQYVRYSVDATGLTQWTTFNGSPTLTDGSTDLAIPATLHTLGPKLSLSPLYLPVDVDSGAVGYDTLRIKNTGSTPLSYVIRGEGGTFPVWMTVNDTDATLPPGDSTFAALAFNEASQPKGDYTTQITVASNDTSTGDVVLQVDLHVGTRETFDVQVRSRWNIVSLPNRPFTHYKTALFPTASSAAYAFTGTGYVQVDTIQNGPGYWLKFPSAQTVEIDGYSLAADTIPLFTGWNIVGAISDAVPVSGVTTVPGGILASSFFEYGTGYGIADSLRPGKGYFVQASDDGILVLASEPAAAPKQAARNPLAGLNAITFEDGFKNAQTLYFGDVAQGARGALVMMPPQPPAGSFDARFVSGAMAEAIDRESDSRSFTVRVAAPGSDAITVRWTIQKADLRRYSLSDGAGTTIDLAKSGSAQIRGGGELTISYSDPVLPKEFALGQNYPNPFNPSTKIGYDLPAPGAVTIKVYNILGNEVTTLVQGVQEAGHHEVVLDASLLPSGVYIYKMQAERFSSIKKMMLMR
jgi:hypothetical protein